MKIEGIILTCGISPGFFSTWLHLLDALARYYYEGIIIWADVTSLCGALMPRGGLSFLIRAPNTFHQGGKDAMNFEREKEAPGVKEDGLLNEGGVYSHLRITLFSFP